MFGILYGLFCGTMKGAAKVKNSIENDTAREKAKNHNELTYFVRGQLHYTENGRLVRKKRLNNGHEVLVDMYSGEIYHDYTEVKEKRYKSEASTDGKSVYNYNSHQVPYSYKKDKPWFKCGITPMYKDINTDVPLGIIGVNKHLFYMNLDNGCILRVVDGKEVGDIKEIERIIKMFNDKQAELKSNKRYGKDRWWMKDYYYAQMNPVTIDEKGKVKRKKMSFGWEE